MKIPVGEGYVADLAKDKITGDWKGFVRGLYLIARKISGYGGVVNWHCRAYPDRRPTGHHGALIASAKFVRLKSAVQDAVRQGLKELDARNSVEAR